MSDTSLLYKHSGRFVASGVAWSFTAMIVLGLVLGFVYGALAWVVPSVWLVFFGAIGLGAGLGFVCGELSIQAKMRNNTLIILGPTLAGVAALYAGWAGYFFAANDWKDLMLNPMDLKATAQSAAKSGLWSIFGSTPKGIFLYGIWLIEAGIIVGGASLVGAVRPNEMPFNENAGAWADQSEVLPNAKALSPETIKQIREQLKQGDVSCFGLFEPDDYEYASMHTAFRVNWAEGFEDEQFLTITSISATDDGNGNVSVKKNPIAQNMIIDPEARAVIDDILQAEPDVEVDPESTAYAIDPEDVPEDELG